MLDGAFDGTRTRDLVFTKDVLYLLSYKGTQTAVKDKSWWAGLDSNQRRRKPAELQSAPFGHSGTDP